MAEAVSIFRVRPPHGNGSGDHQAALSPLAYTASSSSAGNLGITHSLGEDVILVASTDCHVRFGNSSVADATANDFFLPAKTPMKFFCTKDEGYVKAIRDSVSGSLYAYKTG